MEKAKHFQYQHFAILLLPLLARTGPPSDWFLTNLFLPLLFCRPSTLLAALVVGHLLCPPSPHTPPSVVTPLHPSHDVAEPYSLQHQWGVCVSVRMWGRCTCVCLHVSVWKGRKNWVSSYLFKQSQNVLKIYSPIFSVLLLHPVSHESHYALQWDVKREIMLYSTKGLLNHWHNPYLNISFIYSGSQSISPFMYWVGILGMRYEAENCTILISTNRAFTQCQFCCKLNFDPKTMDYGQKGDWHHKWLLMLITLAQSPASYLIHTPRFNVSFLGQW